MELKEWGYVDTFPSVIAVQAANCAPLAVAGMAGSDAVRQIPTSPTIAEGIASAAPARGEEILAMMKQMGGRFVTVSEQSIIAAQEVLAKRGLFVESTSAANHGRLSRGVEKRICYTGYASGGAPLRCRIEERSLSTRLIG